MCREKGTVSLLVPLLILVMVAALAVFYLAANGTQLSKYVPESVRPFINSSATSPKAVYTNPLDKKSQYTNPFSETKNPFDSLK